MDWIEFINAIGTISIGFGAILIGRNQWKINNSRLKYEMFEKRLKCFSGISDFLIDIISKWNIDIDNRINFWRTTQGGKFLFDKKIGDFIKEIDNKAHTYIFNSNLIVNKEKITTNSKIEKEQTEILQWFQSQFLKLEDKFEDYLLIGK